MRKTYRALAIAAALAATPMAFAQDSSTTDTATTTTTATPKRFSVVGGYAHMVPKSNPGTLAGQSADLDGNGAATLSGTWHVDDHWAVELWGTPDKFKTDVNLANGGRGSYKQQPIAVSGQYHFGQASQPIRPFVGLGYYESNIDDERSIRRSQAATMSAWIRRRGRSRRSARTSTSPIACSRVRMRVI